MGRKMMVGMVGWSLLAAATFTGCGGQQPSCTTDTLGGRSCVPTAAKANTELTLLARPNGCANACEATVTFHCKVTVTGQVVDLELTDEVCEEPNPSRNIPFAPQQACTLACQIPDPLPCTVPPLAEGDYTVRIKGETAGTLPVRAAGETTCTAPSP